MSPLERMKGRSDFKEVYNKGKSFADRFLVLYSLPNGLDYTRFGFSVGKKVGNAVVRNRYKRKIKEITRIHGDEVKKGVDCVIIVRPKSLEADYKILEKSFVKLLKKSDVVKK